MTASPLIASVDHAIAASAFSGVVSIRRHDEVVYTRAAGLADRSHQIANTPHTRFGIASGTKFFTALAIGQLIAQGRLKFSTRLNECVDLPFSHYAPEITLQHLLTHTSGIPDYFDETQWPDPTQFTLSRPWYTFKGPRDYLADFPDAPMMFAPGSQFAYCNGGYILLGLVIEAVTGQTYQHFVEESIFRAAGMSRSGFFAFNQLPEQTAWGYIEDAAGWRTNIYNLPIVGASDGGAYTTVDDLAALWRAFWAYQIVPAELVAAFTRPSIRAEVEGEAIYYGHGVWINQTPHQPVEIYMLGGDAGVSFRSAVWPTTGLQLTVIANTTDGAWPVVRDVRAALKALSL